MAPLIKFLTNTVRAAQSGRRSGATHSPADAHRCDALAPQTGERLDHTAVEVPFSELHERI